MTRGVHCFEQGQHHRLRLEHLFTSLGSQLVSSSVHAHTHIRGRYECANNLLPPWCSLSCWMLVTGKIVIHVTTNIDSVIANRISYGPGTRSMDYGPMDMNDIEDELDSIGQFTTELVVEAAVRCLDVIQPGLGLPHSLPPNMAARFHLGASIAQACKSIGYKGDIGYQTFLYSSEADVRRVLMFLIEKLPKESEKISIEPSGKHGSLEKQIGEVIRKQLSSPWLPSYCKQRGVRWYDDGSWSREGYGTPQPFLSTTLSVPKSSQESDADISQVWRNYYVHHLPFIMEQVPSYVQLLPSIITLNAKAILASKRPVPLVGGGDSKKLSQRVAENIVRDVERCSLSLELPVKFDSQDEENTKLKELKEDVTSRFALSEKLQFTKFIAREAEKELGGADNRNCASEMRRNAVIKCGRMISEDSSAEERMFREKQERSLIKKRTYDLLPESDINLNKLQTLVETSAQKLVSLASQWEKHRVPLLEQFRNAKEQNSNRASESQKKVDAVRGLREKVRELGEEAQSKEQLHSQLLAEYEKVTKDINRSAYTRRIMEIIGNIRKQKDEINKVINDTKELKKEINMLTGRLDRSFTVADELIFRDAKRDETSRRAYKLLATLHSDCSEVVQMIEETGATVREIRDLEEQIEIHGTGRSSFGIDSEHLLCPDA
uniref:Coiled-coil domain-containing protein 22 homolog n=1 Tax=Timema monikensis TaxID=170555 RepID=A0A7R9EE37_9NEOP|nr:unnamed protein product [Timema monikensis]